MKKSWKYLFILTALIIGGCANNDQAVEEAEELEQAEEELVEAPSLNTYPLTGLETEEEIDKRVIGVTINNHPAARPQSGLKDADIVYEILSEYEVTRLVALYQSELPERVGPVRSARPYHIDLVNGYQGILVHHGWSPEAQVRIERGEIDSLNGLAYDGTLFQRSSERKAPHNSYITSEHIVEGVMELNYSLESEVTPLTFHEQDDIRVVGVAGDNIEINYYNLNRVHYEYDEQSGYYHRYNGEDQTIDLENELPIELSNLFIVETGHTVLDDQGRRAIDLTSGGRGILFQSGIAMEVNWESRDGQIIPVNDGQIVPFKRGQSWINIVPTDPGLEKMVTY
ncbi:DUF3048 domain-containing protein [Halalkalibacter krulwichiae]|uniref:Putative lipoprotein YerB n=1 Tax=Halalkalibacter krulwichiae TaxID=199441 RepID=A0A1X9ME53_9BACI|nr:DUF3048 domain-containing protein [Halalkalibacter krulwichiae]ARK28712.1 Putative lipoprotein YerB precursor [Halalkalibacter krulwichiae]